MLIDAGCDLTKTDKKGLTIAHWAALKGNTDCLRLAYEFGCDIEQSDNGWTNTLCS